MGSPSERYRALFYLFVGLAALTVSRVHRYLSVHHHVDDVSYGSTIMDIHPAKGGFAGNGATTRGKQKEKIFQRKYNFTKDDTTREVSDLIRTSDNKHNDSSAFPIWSNAFALAMRREGHAQKSIQEVWKDSNTKFRKPGRGDLQTMRVAMELVTYGLGGILPYYGKILPALRYRDKIVSNTTKIRVAEIPDAALVVLDLHECRQGRKTKDGEIVQDGHYNVCYFPTNNDTKDDLRNMKYKKHCFIEKLLPGQELFDYQRRFHNPPAAGHELWSCSDLLIMEQLVAAQVLDFLVCHTDRFYDDRGTNNVFFLEHQRPIQFVSIDHDREHRYDIFRNKSYKAWVKEKHLLNFDMPRELRSNLRSVRLVGSREDFVRNLNVSIDGQLDHLTKIFAEIWSETPKQFRKPNTPPNATALTDILWTRFESLVNFFNITVDD